MTTVFPKTFLAKIKPRKSQQMKEKGKNGARKVKEVGREKAIDRLSLDVNPKT